MPARTSRRPALTPPLGSGPIASDLSCPAARSPMSASPTTGRRTCRSRGLNNFDRIRRRVLWRRECRVRGLRQGRHHPARGEHLQELGDALRLSRHPRRAGEAAGIRRRAPRRHGRLRGKSPQVERVRRGVARGSCADRPVGVSCTRRVAKLDHLRGRSRISPCRTC